MLSIWVLFASREGDWREVNEGARPLEHPVVWTGKLERVGRARALLHFSGAHPESNWPFSVCYTEAASATGEKSFAIDSFTNTHLVQT